MLKKHKHKRLNQSGLASLIVVSVMAVVLGLMSVGFSRLMNREVRRSLDNTLNAQAYYSALAGLNDARAYLASNPNGSNTVCNPPADPHFVANGDLGGGAKYSCVLITHPQYIQASLNDGQSRTFKVDNNNSSMVRLYFDWQSYPESAAFSWVDLGSASPRWFLPQATTVPAGATGLLEVNIYPVPRNPAPTNNPALEPNSRTYFFYPAHGSGALVGKDITSTSQNGNFLLGKCSNQAPNPVSGTNYQLSGSMCNAYLYKLNGANNYYYVRLTARYAPITVNVQAANASAQQVPGGTGNNQTVMDITGQGTDVFQRIVEWLDTSGNMQTPQYGLQSMLAICKGFRTDVVSNPNPNVYKYGNTNFNSVFDQGDGACDQVNPPSTATNGKTVTNSGQFGH